MAEKAKVQTTTGIMEITLEQLLWLQTEGWLIDMSQHPQALPTYGGSQERLHGLLNSRPRKDPEPKADPVAKVQFPDPEDPEGTMVDARQPEEPQSEGSIIVALLKEQNLLLREQTELLRQQMEQRKELVHRLSQILLGFLNA